MSYTIHPAAPEDIRPALDLALRIFAKYEAPDYPSGAIEQFKADCVENEDYIDNYISGRHLMFVALDNQKIIGIVCERGDGHISMLFVDGAYHRRGIATALMRQMVCELKLRGFDKITVNSSPYGLPFYQYFGFTSTASEQRENSFIFIPMAYIPNEIWDVLDADGNKTGRYAERGRPMASGEYFLIVHVWKRNAKGEWLIDKRSIRENDDLSGMWETTGGAALAGEDSLTAALREAKEELDIDLKPQDGTLFRSYIPEIKGHGAFCAVWVFTYNEPIKSMAFDGSEVCDARWATADKIREMQATGEFLGEQVYPYFDEMIEKWEKKK
ncbi:MAG: GNAT family N-acetyltransferase [Oscillospiraceae bacterium]|nr:GNAT family N-acetyltransferase [Oscillospiraceae bacterium]